MRREVQAALGLALLVAVGCGPDEARRRAEAPPGRPFDPMFSVRVAGTRDEQFRDAAVGADGTIYVCGGTASSGLPGALPRHPEDGGEQPDDPTVRPWDVLVVALRPEGRVLWSRRIGGPNYDRAYAIEVAPDGDLVVAGRAGRGFPVTPGTVQPEFSGGRETLYGEQDGFVMKLTPDGRRVVWATYFGTDDPLIVRDVAVAADGRVYLAAAREAGDWPTAWEKAFVNGPAGGRDTIAACLEPDGRAACWARYVGGSELEGGSPTLRWADDGTVVVATVTRSPDFPATPGAYDTEFGGGEDMAIVRLDAADGSLRWATFLGGEATESSETHALAIDAAGGVYVAGGTESPDFPVTEGAFQTTYGGTGGFRSGRGSNYPGDMFVSHLSADGATLLASTFLGGRRGEGIEGVVVDRNGEVIVSGATFSPDFPVTAGCFRAVNAGRADLAWARLAPGLDRLVFSTYVGGSDLDHGRACAEDGRGGVVVAGESRSPDWPDRGGDPGPVGDGGGWDGVVVRFVAANGDAP